MHVHLFQKLMKIIIEGLVPENLRESAISRKLTKSTREDLIACFQIKNIYLAMKHPFRFSFIGGN